MWLSNRCSEALLPSRVSVSGSELGWLPVIIEDPDGGRIVLYPHLPCVRMPSELRTREHWDGLALIASAEEVRGWPAEEKEDQDSPGVHVAAAMASGTILGRLLDDLTIYEVDGPSIPDPEPMRLLHHAENARGGMPIYALEPSMDDEGWIEWMTRAADEQVSMSSLLSSITVGRRWKKLRAAAVRRVSIAKGVDSELGAAAASSAAWWTEENKGLSEELRKERSSRLVARMRGSLANLREGRVDDSESRGPSLMVPVHQPRLHSLVEAFEGWPAAEPVNTLGAQEDS
uniref:Uncharacterized protein n=1 Tax=uncultured marine group II/III euryarchaeote KM3_141_E04 TaxID=1457878 RepID=A0A075GHN9_9EURY|nr:hypothetical protein [uncultured marine group II/III euryarchaeote KM3_141_E04]